MLQIAQDLNLSVTAVLSPLESAGDFAIRYFSPKMEILLCGHATLASAKVVFSIHELNEVHFINIQNLDLSAKELDGHIMMEFPVYGTGLPMLRLPCSLLWGSKQSRIRSTMKKPKSCCWKLRT